jgi:DNA modification methylase
MPTLDWIGKKAVVNHHREVPYRLLHCDKGHSGGDADAGNLLVQGDNLHALKALLPYYADKVKCIYIDPPYNTGNENWVYNDNVNSPEIRKWLRHAVGREGEDLSRHDKWLCMMYPRLALLKEFLTEDGAIFISIDDNEIGRLKILMEEVFGTPNELATLVWEKGKKGDAKFFSVSHEYVVVFANKKSTLVQRGVKWRKRKAGAAAVLEHYQQVRNDHPSDHEQIRKVMMKWFRSLPNTDVRKGHKHYNWSDDRGLYFPDNFHGPDDGRESRPRYDIIHPTTGKPCAKPSTGWRWEEERTKAALAEKPPRIHFGPDETTIPCRKSYLFEVNEEPFQSVFYTDGRAATLEVERLVGKGAFGFPKDSRIIAELASLATDKNSLILDSFAGSGTTGHAVLALNKADGGNRRFILVEMDENICRDVTAQRLTRVIDGYGDVAGLGGGYRFCTLGEPLFDELGQIREGVKFPDLAAHIFFTETGTPIPQRATGKTPLLGVHDGKAVYLLFNGVMGDKRPQSGNVLTGDVLRQLPAHDGTKIIYGESCRLGVERLRRAEIVFKQVPYEIKVS